MDDENFEILWYVAELIFFIRILTWKKLERNTEQRRERYTSSKWINKRKKGASDEDRSEIIPHLISTSLVR